MIHKRPSPYCKVCVVIGDQVQGKVRICERKENVLFFSKEGKKMYSISVTLLEMIKVQFGNDT